LTICTPRAKILVMMNSGDNDSLHSRSLSTLIGYITGPKAEQPVGVRVVEPPPGTRQYQRGNMYGVVDLAGDHPDIDVIADHLLTVMQRSYYSSKGSQSQVMVEAVRQAQQALREINMRHPLHSLRAGVLCSALLNGRLMVATSGPAMALVRATEQVHMFPAELGVALPPSSGEEDSIQVFRQDLTRDDVIFVGGGSWLSHIQIKGLAGIVAYTNADNCAEAADELYAYGGEGSPPGLLIVLTLNPNAPRPGPQSPGTPPPPKPKRPRFGGLPTALSAAPPARGPSAPSTPAPSGLAAAQAAKPMYTAPGGEADLLDTPPVERAPQVAGGPATEDELPPAGYGGPLETPVRFDSVAQEAEQLSSDAPATPGAAWLKEFLARMLPDRREPTAEESERAPVGPSAESPLQTVASLDAPLEYDREATAELGDEELEPAAASKPPPPLPEFEPFSAPAPASGTRARVFILLALVLLALVPTVVFLKYWEKGTTIHFEAQQLTDLAKAKLISALTAQGLGDKAGARAALIEAREYLSSAIAMDGSNEQRNKLAPDIERALQEVLLIQPLYALTVPMAVFPPEARPVRVHVQDGGIYILDAGRQAVLRYRFDPASGEMLDTEPQTILQQGDIVDGATVGSLADIAWMEQIPSVEDRAVLLVLDRNNNLFRYDPRVEGASLYGIDGPQHWRSASQVETFGTRIYVADEGLNQIFRYPAGQAQPPVDPWFAEGTLVNLAGVISLKIDGDIWVLFGNGNILRYQSGEQVPFSLEAGAELAQEPVDMYVMTKERSEIYLADAGEDRILVYTKDGIYEKQLVAAEGDLLSGLSGIYIDEIGGRLYILTKTALYSHPLP